MFLNSVPEEPDEDAKPKTAPVFVSKPEPVTVEEGEWARFCARVTGHPRPRVMWLINGHTVVNVRINRSKALIGQLYNVLCVFVQTGIALQAHLRRHVPFGYSKNSSI